MPTLPRDDLSGYLRAYPIEMGLGEEAPATVLERYHTPDIVWVNDGVALDRDRLVAHARPARRNAVSVTVEVHDALVDGDRVAARYSLDAQLRSGDAVSNEIYLFGRLAPDGRLQRIVQRTAPRTAT